MKYVNTVDRMNFYRFGHAPSYKTVNCIYQKIANNHILDSFLPNTIIPGCYLVQMADNFDL